MKIFKIVVAVAGLLLLAGIAVIVSQFDAGRVKAEAVRAVAEKTGRTLRIDGDLALSFWPDIGLRVGRVALSEPRRAEPFAAVNEARVALAVLPLLTGRVVVKAVAVDGLQATLIKRRDGSLNIDDLLGGAPPEPAPADGPAKPATPAAGGGFGLEIAGIDISHAELVWQDEKAGKTTRISGLDLHTDRVLADTGRRTYAVSDLSLALKGAVGSDSFSVQVEAPKLAVSPDKSSGAAVKLRAEVSGAARRIDLTLSVDGFDGQDGVLKVGQLAVKVDAGFGEAALSGQLSSPLVADLERQTIALDKVEGQFDWRQPQAPTKTLKLVLAGALQADLAKQSAGGRLKVQAGESNLALKLAVGKFSPLAMTFDLDVDRLNIDQYRAAGGQGGAARAPAGDGQGGAKAAGEGFDFSPLNGLDVTGAVRIGQLQVQQLKLSQLNLPIRVADGRLAVTPMTAGLYDGSLKGALALDGRGNAVTLRQQLSGINLAPLLADLADTDLLEGRGDVSVDLSSRGRSVDEMKRRLAGSARIALGQGAIRGIDLEQTLRDVQRLLGKAKDQPVSPPATGKTAFSELTASFAIANGVARNDDLLGQSALLRVQGQGVVDIGNNRLDYRLKASAPTGASEPGAKGLARLKGVAVPVRLSGALDQPAWTVDGEALAGELARAGAQEALQKAGKKLEEKLLEGLFKKK